MSEFSESYHVRTDDPAATLRRIRGARLAGLALPPSAAWLTFGPFANSPAFRRAGGPINALRSVVREPFLFYRYAEDHGWMFELYRPGVPVVAYECWWDPEPVVERSKLDLAALKALLSDPSRIAELERCFRPGSSAAAEDSKAAYRFAELLGLPAYQWLSPLYAQSDPESFRIRGAKMIGRRPPDAADLIPLPPSRTVHLDRQDLSAREAFMIADMIVRPRDPAWFPEWVFVQGAGPLLDDVGRLTPHAEWGVHYRRLEGTVYIRVLVSPTGRVVVSADDFGLPPGIAAPAGMEPPPKPTPLPADWLDSPEAMAAIANEPEPKEYGQITMRSMSLHATGKLVVWEIMRHWGLPGNLDHVEVYITHFVDARTGGILGEAYRRKRGAETLEEWFRRR